MAKKTTSTKLNNNLQETESNGQLSSILKTKKDPNETNASDEKKKSVSWLEGLVESSDEPKNKKIIPKKK